MTWPGVWHRTVLPSSIREVVIKPTPEELGIDPDLLAWERSGDADGSLEIAFPLSARWSRGDWVLLRVLGDRDRRILVFDRNEWECFIDGARNGEFDGAAGLASDAAGLASGSGQRQVS